MLLELKSINILTCKKIDKLKNQNKKAKKTIEKPVVTQEEETVIETRHVQARLLKQDSIRFKRAAEDRNLTLHDGLIEAMNLMMVQWGESPISNIGANKKVK